MKHKERKYSISIWQTISVSGKTNNHVTPTLMVEMISMLLMIKMKWIVYYWYRQAIISAYEIPLNVTPAILTSF